MAPAAEAPRPNLIVILTDDQRYDTLACNGSKVVETPHLDRLAREGARHTRAYVTTSLCCPARASLYTGLYATTTRIRSNEDDVPFLAEHPDLAELLQQSGYATGFFGKWHIPNPDAGPQPGFDRWVSFEGQGSYVDERYNVDGVRQVIPGYNTDVLFDLAMDWMSEQGDRPYCVVLSLKNLHRPPVLPERHTNALAGATLAPRPSTNEPLENLPKTLQRASQGRRNGDLDEKGSWKSQVRGYHELVLSIDDNVGRLLDRLSTEERLEQSAICMTSDGGFLWGEHRLYRKRAAYEESVHVPMLWRWPAGIGAGSEPAGLSLNVDILPTLLEIADVEIPSGLHGRSLAPLWSGDDDGWRPGFTYLDGWGKVLDGPIELAWVEARFKYVRYRRIELDERLFDLEVDPDELHDLSRDPSHAARIEAMRGALREDLARIGGDPRWVDELAKNVD